MIHLCQPTICLYASPYFENDVLYAPYFVSRCDSHSGNPPAILISINTLYSGTTRGVVFGTAGVKLLSSKDAKKVYTNCTAAVLRAKDCVMKTATTVQENAEDILAEAQQINEKRAQEEAMQVQEDDVQEDGASEQEENE